jgi:glycosyltransferase involved in cell wall biosynthesis
VSATLPNLTVLIITHNEEANIARTLDRLTFADFILVVDSFSTDATLAIIARYPRVKVVQREFTSFAEQCNFGLEHVITEWVMSLDADYILPAEVVTDLKKAMQSGADFHEAAFDYCIEGRPVRGGILPPRVILFLAGNARYVDDGHGHQLAIDSAPKRLPFCVRHDDRKPLSRWLASQVRYAQLEAGKLEQAAMGELNANDRLRKWRGLFYALQRFTAELLLSLFLIERIIKKRRT